MRGLYFADAFFRVLVKGPYYVFLGAISLLNLKALLIAMADIASRKDSKDEHFLIVTIKPLLIEIQPAIKNAFGPPKSFKFDFTHVMLMAILLALLSLGSKIIHASEDTREAIEKKSTKI
eukprot:gb/GEZN01025991.1/.p1 GENE.gb/GEZN01025991.1/~~gb/GEZN01025991.1/.p1  ORF type:complete len:120 (-),score=3.83 gb/GEZN01025991.1/:153-512(-)